MTLDELQPGQGVCITRVDGSGALRHHLLDMGLTPHTDAAEDRADARRVSTMRREIGGYHAFLTVIVQCAIAWLAAYAVRLLALLFV